METDCDVELLRRVAAISGKEYGLALALCEQGVTSPGALNQLVQRAARDRLRLARRKLGLASALNLGFVSNALQVVQERLDPEEKHSKLSEVEAQHDQELRTSISLTYYSMYHAARALVIVVERRDEDDHAKVARIAATILQDDLGRPGVQNLTWEQAFEKARRLRNEVDYSPYPDFREPIWELVGLPLSMAQSGTFALAIETVGACEECLAKRGVDI